MNPCGEYIMDHRSTTIVDGQSFRQWFIYDYMISNETLFHKNPVTGKPQMITLGWMDDVRRSESQNVMCLRRPAGFVGCLISGGKPN